MRIAIVANPQVPVPPVKYGGIEQVEYYLIKGLQEEGHEPILFGTADSKADCEIVPITDEAIYFPKKHAELPAHQRHLKRIAQKTARLLRENMPRLDIIHSQGFDMTGFEEFPQITTLHNPITLEMLPYYAERKHLYYVSISKNQQSTYPDLNYVSTVYNGLDPAAFPVVEKPQDYLCFLGRFDAEKSPHLAIELALQMNMPIKIAGKIAFEGETYFPERIEPYLQHPLVEYLGELNFNDKVELLSNARCNIHPTNFREPFGLTVLEAAYCGTPTLAINRGSMSELIENGHTGSLVEDFVEGYHHMQECFEMDRLYIASRAWSLFNYRTMARDYLKAYQRVIDAYHPHGSDEQTTPPLPASTPILPNAS